MVFSSVTFLFYFLPIFIACYFLTPTIIGKNVVTLIFSLVFYAWGVRSGWRTPAIEAVESGKRDI